MFKLPRTKNSFTFYMYANACSNHSNEKKLSVLSVSLDHILQECLQTLWTTCLGRNKKTFIVTRY